MIFRSILAFIILSLITTPAHAKDSDIHSMLVGKKVLELVENRQLTFGSDGEVVGAAISPDGKNIVYNPGTNAYLIKTSGGRPIKLLSEAPKALESSKDKKNKVDEKWVLSSEITWSPNSKWFAFVATNRIGEDEEADEQKYIMIFSSNGAYYASMPIYFVSETGSLLFSPDSSKVAAIIEAIVPDTNKLANIMETLSNEDQTSEELTTSDVIVFDLSRKEGKFVHQIDGGGGSISWADKGQALTITTKQESGELTGLKLWSDGRIEKTDGVSEPDDMTSPDGKLQVVVPQPDVTASPEEFLEAIRHSGIKVRNIQTQETKQAVEGDDSTDFISWLPDSKLLLYTTQPLVLTDSTKNRKRELNTLWIASNDSSKNNTMCIALDFTEYKGITASSDCLRIAYISNSRLYVAELAFREPTPVEKCSAGLPLGEEEMKEVMLRCSKTVGMAITMYATDWDGQYPKEASLLDDLKPYIEAGYLDNDLSEFLNSGKLAIRYLISDGTNVEDIQHPATTPMAEFDAGYNWKIILYVDGRSQEVSK